MKLFGLVSTNTQLHVIVITVQVVCGETSQSSGLSAVQCPREASHNEGKPLTACACVILELFFICTETQTHGLPLRHPRKCLQFTSVVVNASQSRHADLLHGVFQVKIFLFEQMEYFCLFVVEYFTY